MTDFESNRWQEQFPGADRVTSIVDFQVAHPLVTNAGDILLEHALRQDGKQPMVNWRPANPEAKARAQSMGFVEVDEDDMVLDAARSGKWKLNDDGSVQLGLSVIYVRLIVMMRWQRSPTKMGTLCSADRQGLFRDGRLTAEH
ncbi:hypothetical protein P0R31_37205 [Bradyrhizobium yuanmingense]|uniref:hypothetical protein n=1 Tax=Bradyrhizobium yuanmingense TaxID=108015 RepID=UPI0023B941E8|nr:hypothetical protein [Bradyrhizobium yuanmingense]MDF0522876.1 hypothetical protein [Bradyrhizobium yuanmingense]